MLRYRLSGLYLRDYSTSGGKLRIFNVKVAVAVTADNFAVDFDTLLLSGDHDQGVSSVEGWPWLVIDENGDNGAEFQFSPNIQAISGILYYSNSCM